MTDIKTKKKQEISIKKLDRVAVMGQNLKSNIVNVKNKTKQSYEKNENTAQEYAENKINNTMKDIIYYTPKLNKKGKQNLEKTRKNITKGKVQIKKAQKEIRNIKQKGKTAIKETQRNIKTVQNTIKSARNKIRTTEKTAKKTIKSTKQIAKNNIKMAQRTVQMTKQIAKTTIKSAKLAVKTTITIIKTIIGATKTLISALIAGGWVAVVIIVVICLIGMIYSSIFGIFLSNEKGLGDKTMSSVITEINTDFTNKIIEIQKNIQHDEYQINSNKTQWKDILSLYAVIVNLGEEYTDVIILDDNKINKLKEIFWQMNTINSRVDEIEKDVEVTDENGNINIEKKKIKILHIDVVSKTMEEMIELYNLDIKQKEQLAELQKDEYKNMWSYVIYGSSVGSNDIVQVALSQVGNVGGQPYWSWYGFSSRVEWCACFVSFCANECGYIESGIIPKFASCQAEGVSWFKTCELWKEGDYIPKAGDIIFFDWEKDGHSDHVGIVEKVEDGKVYTIEGNSGDICQKQIYNLNSSVILGYGTPTYE